MAAAIPPDLLAIGDLMATGLESIAAEADLVGCEGDAWAPLGALARCWRAAIARIDQDHPITQESSPC